MKKTISIIIDVFLLISIFLSSCSSGPGTQMPLVKSPTAEILPQPTQFETKANSLETPGIADTPTPFAEEQPQDGLQISYHIQAALNYADKSLDVSQEIILGGLPAGVNEISLVVEPNRYTNGFVLNTLEIDGTIIGEYSLDGNVLKFQIPQTIDPNQENRINLVYTIYLPAIPPPSEMYKPQPYGYTDRQLNLVDWYPFVPPLDDDGQWLIHKPPVFGESLVYPSSSIKLEFTVSGSNQPLVIAASSPAQRIENRYTYSMEQVRTFAVSISAYYSEIQAESGGISIKSYAFAGYEAQNEMVLQNAVEALDLFSRQFGDLPRESVSIVQADFLDGMEYDGLYFVSKGFYDLFDGTVKGYLTLITVHEMAHQWWFSVVGNDQAMDPWLDESLATFAEQIYFEQYYPDLVDWWRYYRIGYYEPTGVIDLPIYEYGSYSAYRNAVYLRGAEFFDSFREKIGEQEFIEGLQRYYAANKYKLATEDRFFSSFTFASDADFSTIIGDYFSE